MDLIFSKGSRPPRLDSIVFPFTRFSGIVSVGESRFGAAIGLASILSSSLVRAANFKAEHPDLGCGRKHGALGSIPSSAIACDPKAQGKVPRY